MKNCFALAFALSLGFAPAAFCGHPSEEVAADKLVAEFHVDTDSATHPRVSPSGGLFERVQNGDLEHLDELDVSPSDQFFFSLGNVTVRWIPGTAGPSLPYVDGGSYTAELRRADGTRLVSTVRMPSLIPVLPGHEPLPVKKNRVEEVTWGALAFQGSTGWSFAIPSTCRGTGHVSMLPRFSGLRFESDFAAACRGNADFEFLLGNSRNGDGYGHFTAATHARLKIRFVD